MIEVLQDPVSLKVNKAEYLQCNNYTADMIIYLHKLLNTKDNPVH